MPNPNIKEIVNQVHTILGADALTKTVNWERGDIPLDQIRTLPAGTVSLAPQVDIRGDYMPTGMGGVVPVQVRIRARKHESTASTEQSVEDILSNIVEVLWNNRKLGLTRVKTIQMVVPSIDSNSEASPPYAEAVLIVNALIHLV